MTQVRRKLVYRDPAILVGYERNARTHSDEQICQIRASIDAFGATNPILLDEHDGIIAGHGRRDAALLEPPLADFPCIVLAGLTAEQKRALVIADNKIALNAGWDMTLLQAELADLRAGGTDLGLLGFSTDEALAILARQHGGLTDPDAAPPLEEVAVSAIGDVWYLAAHRLVCGDCTDPAAVRLALDGTVPHLMVTDPPYGVQYDPGWRKRAGHGSAGSALGVVLNDDQADWRDAWALFPGAVAYVWHASLQGPVVFASLVAARFTVRAQIIWVKARTTFSRGHYHWQHEPCFYAVADGETASWHGGRKQSTVWSIDHFKSETGHGTQKPVEAMRRPMENNSIPGQHVYEPFSGSGTTLIAADMTGRICHALELSPLYVDMAVRRWQEFTGAEARLNAADGPTFDEVAAQRVIAEPQPV